jgi:hypothetical protein
MPRYTQLRPGLPVEFVPAQAVVSECGRLDFFQIPYPRLLKEGGDMDKSILS